MNEVAGRLLHFDHHGRFVYEYICACGRKFRGSSPTISAPALCHRCYTGGNAVVNRAKALRKYHQGKQA